MISIKVSILLLLLVAATTSQRSNQLRRKPSQHDFTYIRRKLNQATLDWSPGGSSSAEMDRKLHSIDRDLQDKLDENQASKDGKDKSKDSKDTSKESGYDESKKSIDESKDSKDASKDRKKSKNKSKDSKETSKNKKDKSKDSKEESKDSKVKSGAGDSTVVLSAGSEENTDKSEPIDNDNADKVKAMNMNGGGLRTPSDQTDDTNEGTNTNTTDTNANVNGGGLMGPSNRTNWNDQNYEYGKKRCKRDKFFNTTILVEHDGLNMDKETREEELLALAMSFADTYNIMNAPNWHDDICDKDFRKIDSIDLQAMGSFERVFEDDSFDFRRIHLYHVSASCQGQGCGERSVLFDVEDDRRGRKLTDKRAFYSADSSYRASETCRCEKGKEDRSPTTEEFSKVFDDTISNLFYLDKKGKKFNTSVNSATAVFELQEVPCKYEHDNDSFETNVYVEYLGLNHVEKIESDLKDNLERSFRYSYNDLANLFCDPLNRHVSEVSLKEEKIKEENIDRRLSEGTVVLTKKERRRRRRIRLRIKGRCKGCPRKTPLFNDGVLRRALMTSLVGPDGARRQPLPIYKGPYGEEPLGPSIQRLLKKGDVNRCFCSKFPSIERAPSTDEFAFWYNHSKRLADDVEVIDVHEVPK